MGDTYNACFVCGSENPIGLHLDHYYEDESAKAKIMIDERYAGYPGMVHGGIVSSLLDEIMIKSIEHLGVWAVTGNLDIRFRRPTPTNTVLCLTGKITNQGGKVFRTSGKITLEDGTILAEAEGIFMKYEFPANEG